MKTAHLDQVPQSLSVYCTSVLLYVNYHLQQGEMFLIRVLVALIYGYSNVLSGYVPLTE